MDALEFYKSHESAPLPNVGDLVSLTVEELCELMEQYHQSKVNNGVLDDVSQQRELLKAFLEWQQNKYSMPYDTKIEWQIKDFEAFNCG